MRGICRWVALNSVTFLIVTASFIVAVRTIDLPKVPLFYRGVLFLFTTFVFVILILMVIRWWVDRRSRRRNGVPFESIFSALVLSLSLNCVFFVIVPVTIDRSVTTFLLASMAPSDGESSRFTKHDLQLVVERDYLRGFDAVGRRIEEQLVSGNVEKIGADVYALTEQGETFLLFARRVASLYGISPRYVETSGLPSTN